MTWTRITSEQAYWHVYGADAERIGNAIAFELGRAYVRSEGAAALSDWTLARPDGDPDLEAFSALLDALAWSAATVLHEWGKKAA